MAFNFLKRIHLIGILAKTHKKAKEQTELDKYDIFRMILRCISLGSSINETVIVKTAGVESLPS